MKTRFSTAALLAGLYLLSGAHAALAQAVSTQIPPSGEAGRQPTPLEERREDFTSTRPAEPDVVIRPPALDPALAAQTFTLRSLTVNGANAFPAAELQALYARDLGQTITVARLFDILTDIQKLYHAAGYTLSKVSLPEQDIARGDVVFEVIEGYVAEVVIDDGLIPAPILEAFQRDVLAMQPLNVVRLERLLLLLNDRPGLSVGSILSPMPSDGQSYPPGAVRLSLQKNNYKPSSLGYLDINNHGSNFTGPVQLTGALMLDERLPNYSDLTMYYTQAASSQEMRQGGVEYNLPLAGLSGLIGSFRAGRTVTEPGENLDILDVTGSSVFYSAGLSYPLIRQRDRSLYVGVDFNYKNSYTDLLQEALFRDRIRSVSWDVGYSFSDRFYGLNICGLKVVQGLNILGAAANSADDLSRPEGKSSFTKAEFSAARLQAVTPHISILGSLKGQYTNTPLLSGEEFGFGGSQIGRGYDIAEISGDNGVSASFEVRYADLIGGPFIASDVYAFYDMGKVWNIDPLSKDKQSAHSAGLGLRGEMPAGLSMDVTLAFPLTKAIDSPPHYSNESGPRFMFSLRQNF